jgi:hypothetical protein
VIKLPEALLVIIVLPMPAPIKLMFFLIVSDEDQTADPCGTVMVSPSFAEVTQSATSVRDGLAAVHAGVDPMHAAIDVLAKRRLQIKAAKMLASFRNNDLVEAWHIILIVSCII